MQLLSKRVTTAKDLPACIHVNTHTHTDVVLELSDGRLFLSLLFYFFQSFHSWLGVQSETVGLNCLFDWQFDWPVVSLPYSGVYCVNAGLGGDQINRMNSVKAEHTARDGNPLVLWRKASPVKWISGQVGRVEAPHRLTSEITHRRISSEPFPRLIFLCSDLLCMHTVYVSFCLDWLWRKYIYFL